MKELGSADVFEFARFRFDRRGRCLYRLDKVGDPVLLPAGRTALDILGLLVERAGAVVESEEIRRTVWRGKTVEDANLATQIFHLRESIGRDRIKTVSGRGYRFVGPVKRLDSDASTTSTASLQSGARPHLSIVVLPFTNFSNDGEQQYFADGIAADLTTDLSRLADMFVISRHTAFTYRDKRRVDTKEIGRELGVRYVLEGSVRRSGNQVRVNVQLIDAETDAHLWAELFDCNADDLFALQNDITSRIAVALDIELVGAEAARRLEHPDALDYILRGRALGYGKAPARENYAQAISLFERALALDPRSVQAQSWLANALASRVLDGMSDSPAVEIARAEGLVGQALAASPGSPQAHFAKGQLLRAQNRFKEAIPEYETVLTFNRNWVLALAALGWCKFYAGSIEEALAVQEHAIRLSPRDPYIGNWYWRIGMIHLLQSRTEEAIVWLLKARSANSRHPGPHAWLAAAYALKSETSHAAGELAEARRLSKDDRFRSITRFKAAIDFGPQLRALCESTFFAGLRQAGVPET
jgi:TolB-like protein/Tfp pilus assembly protein PilF